MSLSNSYFSHWSAVSSQESLLCSVVRVAPSLLIVSLWRPGPGVLYAQPLPLKPLFTAVEVMTFLCLLLVLLCLVLAGAMWSGSAGRGGRRIDEPALEAQKALRRVATLVARGVSPRETFRAVAGEMARLLGADYVIVQRFGPQDTVTVVGHWSDPGVPQIMPPLGGRWPNEKGTVGEAVFRTGRTARIALTEDVHTEIGSWLWLNGIRYVVSCPIQVEGRIWGTMTVLSRLIEPRPVVTEVRMIDFVELISAAVANSEAHSELIGSRARIVAASDAARHRIERNLHDSVQQRLISVSLQVTEAKAALAPGESAQCNRLTGVANELGSALEELREICHGLHPATLSKSGLQPALRALAHRSPIKTAVEVWLDRRLPEHVEVALYYVVSEALTNTAKHASASQVHVNLRLDRNIARLSVRDNGVGGAELEGGSGLIGLRDRVEGLGGQIRIVSSAGKGTSLLVAMPIESPGGWAEEVPAAENNAG